MALLDELLARLRREPILSEVRLIDSETIDDTTFSFKVRATVKWANLQIRFLSDETFTRYSFQLYGEGPLLRWDNTPHYPALPNFPHHFHDADNVVQASTLTGHLLTDTEIVLAEVKQYVVTHDSQDT